MVIAHTLGLFSESAGQTGDACLPFRPAADGSALKSDRLKSVCAMHGLSLCRDVYKLTNSVKFEGQSRVIVRALNATLLCMQRSWLSKYGAARRQERTISYKKRSAALLY